MDINLVIIKKIRELMNQKNILQKQLAIDLKIPVSSLNNYLTNKNNMKPEIILKFANYFNVSVDYLFGLTESPTGYASDKFSHLEKYLNSKKYNLNEIPLLEISNDIEKIIKKNK